MDDADKTKTTIEVFQNGSADATLAGAMIEFEEKNPTRFAVKAEFAYAYPGRQGEGRWVGISITHTQRNV